MQKKLKLMTIVGTRPELIKLSEVIKRADEAFEHYLVHTGQNYDYELNDVFFEELGLKEPHRYLSVAGDNLGATLGRVLERSYEVMVEVEPDAILVLGDTNSCLSVISAKRLKIPIFHMEAGNRCFDENLPEEVNRRIIDTTSDVNLCYSEEARRNLADMGFPPPRTFVVGSPMREVLDRNWKLIDRSQVLERLDLKPQSYIVLSAHREENVDSIDALKALVSSVNVLAEEFQLPILYSLHPRAAQRIKANGIEFHALVQTHKPFGFADYIALQRGAFCVVSDSGTLAEESAIVGFPAVSLRTSTERPEAVDSGRMVLGGLSPESVCRSVHLAVESQGKAESNVENYSESDISNKVCRIIQGYTPYVNKWVWGREA